MGKNHTHTAVQTVSESLPPGHWPPFCSVLTLFTGLLGETEYLLTRAMMIKMTIIRTLVIILGSVTKSLPLRDINTLKSFFFQEYFWFCFCPPPRILSVRDRRGSRPRKGKREAKLSLDHNKPK